MAYIIIDGYNVIGVMHRSLESERQRFIDELVSYRKLMSHDITVVFDGWKEGEGRENRTLIGGVKVIYSPIGVRADAVIKRLVSESPNPAIVISTDREIQNHAWASGSRLSIRRIFYARSKEKTAVGILRASMRKQAGEKEEETPKKHQKKTEPSNGH